MSFFESIFILPEETKSNICSDFTNIFFSLGSQFDYCKPTSPLDPKWGVICFPDKFKGINSFDTYQIRITNSANYDFWKKCTPDQYKKAKKKWGEASCQVAEEIIGNFRKNIVYEDSFTPVTIEKFTSKEKGAVYGSPIKIKDGKTALDNLYIAGTDQGYLGIVGSMLSGITIVNQYLLSTS